MGLRAIPCEHHHHGVDGDRFSTRAVAGSGRVQVPDSWSMFTSW
jgi:hypothetical protein